MDPPLNNEEEERPIVQSSVDAARDAAEDEHRRGVTLMRKLLKRRSEGKMTRLKWNENGQAIGETAKSLAGFIGCTVRQKVPITITDWRTDRKSHEVVWSEIQVRCLFAIMFGFAMITFELTNLI